MSQTQEALEKTLKDAKLSLRQNGKPKQPHIWTRHHQGLTVKIEFDGMRIQGSISSTNKLHALRELQGLNIVLTAHNISYMCQIIDGHFGTASIEALNYEVSISE